MIKQFFSFVKETKEGLFALAGIITSILYFLKVFKVVSAAKTHTIVLAIDAANALVLILALFFIKSKSIEEEHTTAQQTALGRLKMWDYPTMNKNIKRANILIRQFIESLKGFLVFLILYYAIQFFTHLTNAFSSQEMAGITLLFRNHSSLPALYAADNIVIYTEHPNCDIQNPSNDITPSRKPTGEQDSLSHVAATDAERQLKQKMKVKAASYLLLDILNNALNLFSSSFIFVAFAVLFKKTLNSSNKKLYNHYFFPLAIAFAIFIFNLSILFVESDSNLITKLFFVKLAIGMYAGMGMILLFSRFISMEYYFEKARQWHIMFYKTGILFSLPLYAVVQPLFSVFDIFDNIGSADAFKSGVFLLCLWGKIFFLLFVYKAINDGYMQAFLLMVLYNERLMSYLSDIFEEIKDFDGNKGLPPVSSKDSDDDINPPQPEEDGQIPDPVSP